MWKNLAMKKTQKKLCILGLAQVIFRINIFYASILVAKNTHENRCLNTLKIYLVLNLASHTGANPMTMFLLHSWRIGFNGVSIWNKELNQPTFDKKRHIMISAYLFACLQNMDLWCSLSQIASFTPYYKMPSTSLWQLTHPKIPHPKLADCSS